jgi:hypothetical protein
MAEEIACAFSACPSEGRRRELVEPFRLRESDAHHVLASGVIGDPSG